MDQEEQFRYSSLMTSNYAKDHVCTTLPCPCSYHLTCSPDILDTFFFILFHKFFFKEKEIKFNKKLCSSFKSFLIMTNVILILKEFAHNQYFLHDWVLNSKIIVIYTFPLQKTNLYGELVVRMCINRLTSRTVVND